MDENSDGASLTTLAPPKWQLCLAVFVGVVIANNLVIYGLVGGQRTIFDPAKRLGYEMGTGIGLGIGLTFALWLVLLRKASRKWLFISFAVISISGTLAMLFIGSR